MKVCFLPLPVLPAHVLIMAVTALNLSRNIIARKQEYYVRLRGVTVDSDWQGWILFMLEALEGAAVAGRQTIQAIEVLMDETGAKIQRQLPKVYSKDLVEILFRLPYTKRQFLVQAGLGNVKTVGNYLRKLEAHGFLTSEQVGKEKLYLNGDLMALLQPGAARQE